MKMYTQPSREKWAELIKRPVMNRDDLTVKVQSILKDVKVNGDEALRKYTLEYDGLDVRELLVTEQDIRKAVTLVDPELMKAIKTAAANIKAFHSKQEHPDYKMQTMPGVECWRKNIPVEKVGLYIPGGSAPLFSTVLMLGIPAILAKCKEIIICTPPDKNGEVSPFILAAAKEVGINKIFRVGGAQAIAAMAYGTKSVSAVYKIFGPGNQYVTAAKQEVSRDGVAVDLPAGPSEVAIFADKTAKMEYVAADLLSQAEHGVDSQVLFVTTSSSLAGEVQKEIQNQLKSLPRRNVAMMALEHSKIIVIDDRNEAMDLLNEYAPEHLILICKDAEQLSEKVTNAGSVFIGAFSPESVGDYASGTNHTLPTNGNAKAYSGVNLQSFMKQITFQMLTADGLKAIGPSVELLAAAEGLMAHKNSVTVRLNDL